jgi:hypothetical protein
MNESNKSSDIKDVFISYASEDKEEVVKPLALGLSSFDIKVWYDEFELEIGDSLRRKIDEGLKGSRYGIIILSKHFFNKHYPNYELDGLLQREALGIKVILPVWVGINENDVRNYSPALADRIAGKWEEGVDSLLIKLVKAIKPEIIEGLFIQLKNVNIMEELKTGNDVANVVVGSHFGYRIHDEPDNETEIELVGEFLDIIEDFFDIWNEISASEQMKITFEVSNMLRELQDAGWAVYGNRMQGRKKFYGVEDEWKWHAIAVVKGKPKSVFFMNDKIEIVR